MILRQIRTRGIRCFRNEIVVGTFGEGLNMIFAPNETGKSTLVEAAARAMFDDHGSRAQAIRDLQPWGTSLAPEIELEFDANGTRYRLEKGFLSNAHAALYERRDDQWEGLHERDEADRFVREVLHGEQAHGASDLRHWGLARALWWVQGDAMVGRADDTTCRVSTAVAGQLRRALGGQVDIGSAYELIKPRIDEMYDEHFTKVRAHVKSGSPLDNLEGEIERLQEQEDRAQEALEEVQEAARNLEQICAELDDLEGEKESQQERLDELEQKAQQVALLRTEVEDLKKQVQRAKEDAERAEKQIDNYRKAHKSAQECEQRLEELTDEISEQGTNVKAARKLVDESRDELEEAEKARKEAARARTRGAKLNKAQGLLQQREDLQEKIEKLQKLQADVDTQRQQLDSTPQPEDSDIDRAHQLQERLTRLGAQLEVAGLQAHIEMERDHPLKLSGGSEEMTQDAAAGASFTYHADAEVHIELPDLARIDVVTGAEEPKNLRQELGETKQDLKDLLSPFGADTLRELQDLQADYDARQQKLQQAQEQLVQLADPHEDIAGAQEALAGTRLELKQLLNELAMSEDDLAAADKKDEQKLETAFEEAQGEEDRLRKQLEERTKHLEKAQERHQDLTAEKTRLQGEHGKHLKTMETILDSADCEKLVELEQRQTKLGQQLEDLSEKLEAKQEELPAPEEDPEAMQETAREALAQIDERRQDLTEQRGNQRGIIDRARTEGYYERLNEAREALQSKRIQYKRISRQAYGTKLLKQVLEERQSQTDSARLPGLEEAIRRMMRHITGADRTVAMDDALGITAVSHPDNGAEHEIAHLSAGTREQLDLVARVAIGEAYSEQFGRTVMVLDDALLYTDPRRHDRVKQILKRAAENLQIFLLTSHPERYRGIVPIECQFDLQALRSGSRA